MRGVSILFRSVYATLALCVLSLGTVFGAGADTFGRPRSGASGIWTEVSAFGARSFGIDEDGAIVEYEEESATSADMESEPSFGLFNSLRVFGEERENVSSYALYRGQVTPPTESPTSTATISSTTVPAASSNVSVPPASLDDRPYAPQTTNSTSEETTFQRVFKNSQDFSASFLYMTASKTPEVGAKPTMRDMEIDARILFACPCGCSSINKGYFLVTPSFTYTGLERYQTVAVSNGEPTQDESRELWGEILDGKDIKDITADAARKVVKDSASFYDFGVAATIETALRDLDVHGEISLGLASSWKSKLTCDSFYVRGRLAGELPVDSTKQVKIVGGAAYYGRIRYKVLPILGFVWKPNPQNEFRVTYPNPRWSHFLTKVNGTDWWFYIHGEIGGGTWFVKDDRRGKLQVDNNDYRVGLGVTFDCSSNLMGSAEIGGAFGRELRFKSGAGTTKQDIQDAFYFKFGLLF